jgi:hypothetical protein
MIQYEPVVKSNDNSDRYWKVLPTPYSATYRVIIAASHLLDYHPTLCGYRWALCYIYRTLPLLASKKRNEHPHIVYGRN